MSTFVKILLACIAVFGVCLWFMVASAIGYAAWNCLLGTLCVS